MIATSPQIQAASRIPLRSLQVYAPSILTDARLASINEQLVASGARLPAGARPRRLAKTPVDPRGALQLETIRLSDGPAPGAKGDTYLDIPTLTIVLPDGATSVGSAAIVAPGGGYRGLASGHEGRQVADWLAAHGIAAFVLSYRLTPSGYTHPAQLDDAHRAIRWVRAHASQFGIAPNHIGMIGISAGGHLTAMASTLFDDGTPNASDPIDRESDRLNFAAVIYGPTLVDTSTGFGAALAGPRPSPRRRGELNLAHNVSDNTPATFMFYTTTDELVSPVNGTAYYDALHAHNIPAELHVFAEGRHGLGLAMTDPALSVWPDLFATWLRGRGMMAAAR